MASCNINQIKARKTWQKSTNREVAPNDLQLSVEGAIQQTRRSAGQDTDLYLQIHSIDPN